MKIGSLVPRLKRRCCMRTHIATLCKHQAPDCPKVFTDDSAPTDKQVAITDDFGNEVHMSKSQLRILVEQAKAGQLDGV